MLEILRTGAWLTRERMRLVALAVLVAVGVRCRHLSIATSDGLNDCFGRPLGTDFSNVYAAGTYVLDGKPAAPFDPPPQYAREQAIFGAEDAVLRLALSAVLPGRRRRCWRLMPYRLALLVWQGVTLALYLLGDTRDRSYPSPWGRVARSAGWG